MIPESTRAGSNLVPNGTRLTTVPVISPGKKRNQKENKGSRSSTRGQVFCPACPLNPSLQRAIDILLAALHPSAPLKIVPSYYTTSARIPLLSLKKLERFANECSALKMRQPDAAPPHSDPLPSKGGGEGITRSTILGERSLKLLPLPVERGFRSGSIFIPLMGPPPGGGWGSSLKDLASGNCSCHNAAVSVK